MFQTLVHHRIRREKHQKAIRNSPGKVNYWKHKDNCFKESKKENIFSENIGTFWLTRKKTLILEKKNQQQDKFVICIIVLILFNKMLLV